MKPRILRNRTESLLETANSYEEYYDAGLQLIAVGKLVQRMASHIADLQRKVDNQAEALRGYQNRQKPICRIVEQLENASYRTESSFDEDGYSNDDAEEVVLLEKAIEIVKRGVVNEI